MTLEEARNKLRDYIKDKPDLNKLLEDQENTDTYLEMCIEDALEEINEEYMPETSWTLNDVPWSLIKKGSILQVLIGAGIGSARNTFSYSDGSSINVNDNDQWGRYINLYNVLISKYERSVQRYKKRKNIDGCYGGVASQYNNL